MRFDWWAQPQGYPEDFGRTIYLLGTAGKGPIREPVRIQESDQAARLFGEQGTLARAAADVYATNPQATIYCFRVAGAYATARLHVPVEDPEGGPYPVPRVGLFLRSREGSEADNALGIQGLSLPDGRAALNFVAADGSIQKTYWLEDYPFLGDLVRTINADATLGDCPCFASTDVPLVETEALMEYLGEGTRLLSGGHAAVDLTPDDLFLALEDSYAMLMGRHIDVVVPLGARLDDAYLADYYGSGEYTEAHYASPEDHLTLWDTQEDRPATFHAQLALFCEAQQKFGWMTHGVIGLRPLTDPTLAEDPGEYVARLILETALRKRLGLVEGEGDGAIDKGGYVSIVAGDLLYGAGSLREHWDTGALAYAAMLAGLDGNLSTTNRLVPGNPPQRIEFDTDTLKDLSFMGVVTFRTSVKQQALVVHNGVTAALPDSDLHQVSNVRMVQLTLANLNALAREFKGEQIADLMRTNEVERLVNEMLDGLKQAGILSDYRFFHQFLRPRRMLAMSLVFKTRNMVSEIGASGEMMLMS